MPINQPYSTMFLAKFLTVVLLTCLLLIVLEAFTVPYAWWIGLAFFVVITGIAFDL